MLKKLFLLAAVLLCLPVLQQSLQANSTGGITRSLEAAQSWLGQVDKGQYAESWESASMLLKGTMSQSEWVKYLETIRKPLGSVSERTLGGQFPAEDTQGLPKGGYMVIVYQTKFSSSTVRELLTLSLGYDGIWRVMTYQIGKN
jgi:hypothetical protein